jgi:ubiquinone/menaquinone biosynthesis C-methylase UbiE
MNTHLENQNKLYNEHFQKLQKKVGREAASEKAVGGKFDQFGKIELELLSQYGLQSQDCIVDVGCGSGRLIKQLSNQHAGNYIGTDVVQDLLDHAKCYCRSGDWKLLKVDELKIPIESEIADFVCFFSVFTHLLHEQSYLYLKEAKRVLKKGGTILFSFLEFAVPAHWSIFEGNLGEFEKNHLNMFIDRDAIKAWARYLDLEINDIVGGDQKQINKPIQGLSSLGQSIAVLKK